MRPVRTFCPLLCLIAGPLAAQTTDWSRLTIGISIGAHAGASLWDVANQPILSSEDDPELAARFPYPPDQFGLHRDVHSGLSLAANVTRFSSAHFGLTVEFAYLGINLHDACTVTHDGGDPDLATACATIGTSARVGATNDQVGITVDQSSSAILLQGGAVLRPFKPGALQPFLKAMIGLATTPRSTVYMESIYDVHVEGVQPNSVGLIIYQDYGWKQVRPVFTAGAGLTTAASSGLQIHLEARESFMSQSIVTGPSTAQNEVPPNQSVLKGFLSVLVGLEVVLKRQHGKRY
jgi:hypothetical protein